MGPDLIAVSTHFEYEELKVTVVNIRHVANKAGFLSYLQ